MIINNLSTKKNSGIRTETTADKSVTNIETRKNSVTVDPARNSNGSHGVVHAVTLGLDQVNLLGVPGSSEARNFNTPSAELSNKIAVNTKVQQSMKKQENELEWKVVSRKRSTHVRNRPLVVGSFSGSTSVEGVEKFKAFHVSNLKPSTTVEDLQSFLNKNFAIAKCEKLSSKYPDSYSSFKVLIPDSDYEKALDGSNWPNKANVHRFFRPRVVNNQTT